MKVNDWLKTKHSASAAYHKWKDCALVKCVDHLGPMSMSLALENQCLYNNSIDDQQFKRWSVPLALRVFQQTQNVVGVVPFGLKPTLILPHTYNPEALQDFRIVCGLDAEIELLAVVAQDLSRKIDRPIYFSHIQLGAINLDPDSFVPRRHIYLHYTEEF